ERSEIETVVRENQTLAAAAIVNIYKHYVKKGNNTRILSPPEIAGRINELQAAGITIHDGTFKRCSEGGERNVRGGSFEVELAHEMDKNGREVVAVGKRIERSDADIIVGDNLVYEAKNYDLEHEDYSDYFWNYMFKQSIGKKVIKYIKDTNKELIVSLRSSSVPEEVRRSIEEVEEEHGVSIKIRADKGYVENE
ncbi:MAG: hypothetical protein ABEI13_02525, partial [Candidatus Paceibacteria bacterium]